MSTRKSLTTLLIVCLIAVYAYYISDYMKQSRQNEALTKQVVDATRTLSLIPKTPADQEKRLAEAKQANQSAVRNLRPGNLSTTQVLDDMFSMGEQLGLKITPLSTEPWKTNKLEEKTYKTLQVEMKIEGKFTSLLDFIKRLEDKDRFPFLAVEKVTVNSPHAIDGTASLKTENDIDAEIVVSLFASAEAND